MEKLTVIELFSGIGAQERALRQLPPPFSYEVINTCDCNKESLISYAAMRWDLEEEKKNFCFPSKEEMIVALQNKGVGFDFQKGKNTISKNTPLEKIKLYYLTDFLQHNLGDITKLDELPYADLVTYSFPCTDLSTAGHQEGMKVKCECGANYEINFSKDENFCPSCGRLLSVQTRSGLLKEVQRLLKKSYDNNKLPKYLLLENVKALVGTKFKSQFDDWISWLDKIGYQTKWAVLNGKYYGVPQNRERVFAVSIRKDLKQNFEFPEPLDFIPKLENFLEKNPKEEFYLPDEKQKEIIKYWGNKNILNPPFIFAERGRKNSNGKFEQVPEINSGGTANTLTTKQKDNYIAFELYSGEIRILKDGVIGTLRTGTQCGDKFIYEKKDIKIRKLTPLEAWRLMGFTSLDVQRAEKFTSKTQLYKQAGNSIIVSCLVAIFYSLFFEDNSTKWKDYIIQEECE